MRGIFSFRRETMQRTISFIVQSTNCQTLFDNTAEGTTNPRLQRTRLKISIQFRAKNFAILSPCHRENLHILMHNFVEKVDFSIHFIGEKVEFSMPVIDEMVNFQSMLFSKLRRRRRSTLIIHAPTLSDVVQRWTNVESSECIRQNKVEHGQLTSNLSTRLGTRTKSGRL